MEKDEEVSGLAQCIGSLKVEDKPEKVLESLSIEGVVNHLKKLQASEDSESHSFL